jgi:FdhD protein
MRTPGHDFELAAGSLRASAEAPVEGVRCQPALATRFNIVTVDTAPVHPLPVARISPTTSSCGLCGSTSLADLAARLLPPAARAPPVLVTILAACESLREYSRRRAPPAAAAVDPSGEPLVVREDIGRHNAVDKVVGRLLLDGALPATDLVLFVSGRASFEIVQKAWAAGFSTLIAVSAPSALAVATARAAGMTLVGFAREGRLNVYAPERVTW